MLITTIILFALAAVLGAVLLTKVFKDEERPKAVIYGHGTAAAIALVLLIVAYINQGGSSWLLTSILVFMGAALGGFVMFGREMSEKTIPKWLAVVHGLIAVTGLVLLLIAVFGV